MKKVIGRSINNENDYQLQAKHVKLPRMPLDTQHYTVFQLVTPQTHHVTPQWVSSLRLGPPVCVCVCDEAAGGGEAAGTGSDPPPNTHVHALPGPAALGQLPANGVIICLS